MLTFLVGGRHTKTHSSKISFRVAQRQNFFDSGKISLKQSTVLCFLSWHSTCHTRKCTRGIQQKTKNDFFFQWTLSFATFVDLQKDERLEVSYLKQVLKNDTLHEKNGEKLSITDIYRSSGCFWSELDLTTKIISWRCSKNKIAFLLSTKIITTKVKKDVHHRIQTACFRGTDAIQRDTSNVPSQVIFLFTTLATNRQKSTLPSAKPNMIYGCCAGQMRHTTALCRSKEDNELCHKSQIKKKKKKKPRMNYRESFIDQRWAWE